MLMFKESWGKLSKAKKVQTIISIILVPCVVTLSLLRILNVLPLELNLIILPILGGTFSLSGMLYKENRALRIVLIGCTLLILFSVIITLVPKMMH